MLHNINVDFFGNDVELDEEIQRADGRVEVRRKGSIRLLDEWLDRVRLQDPEPRRAMIAAFRRVRNLRNSPAHTLRTDEFDQTYVQQQRELMIEAYGAVRTLRLILANHPAVRDYEVSEWYRIDPWTF